MGWRNLAMSNSLVLYLSQHSDLQRDHAVMSHLIGSIETATRMYKEAALIDPVAAFTEVVQSVDYYIETESAEDKAAFSCKKGCDFCCRINVDIYPPEAKIISDYCKQNEIPIDRIYLEQQLRFSTAELPLSTTHSACVFLKEGVCSIYAVRPLACRKYFVLTPAEQCDVRKYPPPNNKVGVYFNSGIEILASAIMDKNDGCDRMPKLLLPYAS